ncbi:MAG: sulfonate ABC transporter permease [Legionellales bacterium]|nr:sulfonate ABC transporter permease [Legionellales bacterium]OUX64617.1 MAG: hypothetical protein CBE41_02885 [Gammaproteobacteria bacterium TMED281]
MNFERFDRKLVSEYASINCWDIIVFSMIVGTFFSMAWSFSKFDIQIIANQTNEIHLDPSYLPFYAFRSILRMLIGLMLSIIFTLIFGTLAAKNPYAERVIIPMVDILQSVPILGFLSFFSWGFLMFFPGSIIGAECAAIFAIFTSQVWNMTLSLYQSIKSLPNSYHDLCNHYQLSQWQKFLRVELPFAMPSLVMNMILSLSSSWFFVVASEVINFQLFTIKLPGIGAYIQQADDLGRVDAIGYALFAMLCTIIISNQLIFGPLFHWLGKFQEDKESAYRSWLVIIFMKTAFFQKIGGFLKSFFSNFYYPSSLPLLKIQPRRIHTIKKEYKDFVWTVFEVVTLIIFCVILSNQLLQYVTFTQCLVTMELGFYTFTRIFVMLAICLLIWVPIGVWIGLRPKVSKWTIPVVQILAAFPVNLVYPLVTILIIKYQLNPEIWVSPLIILGTQWYILFNVIAGTQNIPTDLKLAARSLNLSRLGHWKSLILPAIMPDLLTGIVTAAGGAWNASIIAEYITWNGNVIVASGIGSFITEATYHNAFKLQALGILVMCCYVLLINRLVWAPLYHFTTERFKSL